MGLTRRYSKVGGAFGELVTVRQYQPEPLELQKLLFCLCISLSVSLPRAVRRLLVPLPALLIQIVQHGTLLAVTGGSATGLSATDAWAEPFPVIKVNLPIHGFVPQIMFARHVGILVPCDWNDS